MTRTCLLQPDQITEWRKRLAELPGMYYSVRDCQYYGPFGDLYNWLAFIQGKDIVLNTDGETLGV